MKTNRLLSFLLAVTAIVCLPSCKDNEEDGADLSGQGFFSQETLIYSLAGESSINVPVVRLGTSGDITVNISSSGPSEFNVPSSVIIKDGERMGSFDITFSPSSLAYMESYNINLSIGGFSSIYGYGNATVQIENPMPADFPYSSYGQGTIVEGWWGEEEEKELFYRDCGGGIYQCYLPECWGHDSGAGYPVQDYVFFWDTKTNKLYIPFQFMGCEDWCIGDQGSIACKFGGPGYGDGLRIWREYIDNVYKSSSFTQPHFDPATKKFYLSDSAACDPKTGKVTYGTAGTPDVFTLN